MKKMGALWKLRALLLSPGKTLRVFRDERTPTIAKVLPIVAIVYLFFPIDIVPDLIPFLGQVDDVTIALTLVYVALRFIPGEVLKKHGLDPQI